MIVTFRGTLTAKNNSPQYMAACAVCSASVHSMKTLVLQFYNEYPIEKLLIGKRKNFMSESHGSYMATGMDELFRRVSTQGISKDNFIMSVTPIFEQERILDIATVSHNPDLYDAVINEPAHINTLLEIAQDIYDNIFILLNGKDEKQLDVFDTLLQDREHFDIICIPQGNEQEISASNKQFVKYCISEYDRRSVFSMKYFKSKYASKEIYAIPYNITFKDACMSNDALIFCLNNSRININAEDILELEDTNANFISAIRDLTENIIVNTSSDTNKNDTDGIGIPKGYSFVPPQKTSLNTDNVRTLLSKNGKMISTYNVLSDEQVTPDTNFLPADKATAKAINKAEHKAAKEMKKAENNATKAKKKLKKSSAASDGKE